MYDVIIIGAGLAGLNAARSILNKSGYTVALVSREHSSKNNPMRLTFMETIERFGLQSSIRAAYRSFGIMNHFGTRSLHQYHEERFVALDYQKACQNLRNEIWKSPNLTCFTDLARDFQIHPDHVEVSLRKKHPVKGLLLVDASGLSRFSQKKRGNPLPNLYSHSFGESLINCANQGQEVAWFIGASADYGSGGGWFYPTGPDRASVGFAVITSSVKFPSALLREKYKRAINEISPLREILKSAKAVNLEAGTIPIGHIPSFSDNRLLIVGDAAGQATPWMCMGVEPVLNNSELVARTAIDALQSDNLSKTALSEYDGTWRAANLDAFTKAESMNPPIWFANEAVWDFIIDKDLNALTPGQFYERIRYNAHLMSRWTSLRRWILFRIKHLRDWHKYRAIEE